MANPLLGSWGTTTVQIGQDFIRRQFTFNKDFTFTEQLLVLNTGEVLDAHSGVYAYGGVGPNGCPVVTLFEGGQIYQQEEYSGAAEGVVLRAGRSASSSADCEGWQREHPGIDARA